MLAKLGRIAAVMLVIPLVVSVLPVTAANQQQATITVSGRVTGPEGPVPNTLIFSEYPPYPSTVTDATGFYSLQLYPSRNGDIIAIPSIQTQLAQSSIRLNNPTANLTLNFTVSPGRWLSGQIVNVDGYPVGVDHDIYSSDGRKFLLKLDDRAHFALLLPPDNYTLVLYPPEGSSVQPKSMPIDLTAGDVLGLLVIFDVPTSELSPPYLEDEPSPIASRIRFGPADTAGVRTIIGEPGVIPVARVKHVSLVNLSSGDVSVAPVAADGSFSAQLFAPAGASIYVKFDSSFDSPQYVRGPRTGTIIRVLEGQDAAAATNQTSLALSGSAGPSGHWWSTGTINTVTFQPDETIAVTVTLTVEAPEIDVSFDTMGYVGSAHLELERLFTAAGDPVQRINRGMSTVIAPTGLPIENGWDGRYMGYSPLSVVAQVTIGASHRTGNRLQIPFTLTGTLPISLPHGLYRPVLFFWIDHPTVKPFYGGFHAGVREMAELNAGESQMPFGLPIISVGTPAIPHLPWTLLSDTFANGVRGTRAREDRYRFDLSTKVILQNDVLILPRFDEVTKQPRRYRLEPFVPMVSWTASEDVEPNPPIIPFAFPSGLLTVTVQKPDGARDVLGPAPFVQARSGMPGSKKNYFIAGDRTTLGLYELTTLSDAFIYQFDQYGHHVITMTGAIEDIWGRTYTGGGTYDVYVARNLDLEPAVFPGTPLEVGDVFNPALIIHPSVPASVTVEVRLYPGSNPSRLIHYIAVGKANNYGYFYPGDAPAMTMTAPGEYVADVTAQYWDDDGVFWMGKIRGASVVASPSTPLIARGERGLRKLLAPRPQWFFQKDIHAGGWPETPAEIPPGAPEDWQTMLLLPYQSSDVVWVADRNNNLSNELTFQDSGGVLERFLLARANQYPASGQNQNGSIYERAQVGEMPFISSTSNGWDDALHPEVVDQVAYFYMAVGRAGVAVRNYVAQDGLFRAYWGTDWRYARQLGTGPEGDRPGDVKFQFGGGVFRFLNSPGTADDENHYVIHGTMETVIPMGTEMGNRTMPPFRGNGGGPDGGPLLTLRGQDIDLFITPTGVRPGEILEVGDTFTFAGLMWPTLGAKGTITVTTPSGMAHTFSGQANKVGYFYVPTGNFTVTEPGVHTVTVALVYDGQTSVGQVVPPYPTGDVLGSDNGTFHFYIVPDGASDLKFSWPWLEGSLPGVAPWTLRGNIPAGWHDLRFYYSVLMSGFLLEQGDINVISDTFRYIFDPLALHQDFPNLDVGEAPACCPELVDTITLSFLLTGKDEAGHPVQRASRIDLQGQDYRLHRSRLWTIYLPLVGKNMP